MVDLIGCIVEYEEIMGSIELGEWTFKVVEVNRMKERCAVSLKEEGCEKKNGQNLTKSSLNLLSLLFCFVAKQNSWVNM